MPRSLFRTVFVALSAVLASMTLAAAPAKAAAPLGTPEVYSAWPFDAKEAVRRQDETAKALGRPKNVAVDVGGVAVKFVLIPAGQYKDEAGRAVAVAKPFYLGEFMLTQAQYARVMGKNPSKHAGATLPVDSATWADATAFCKKASEKSKRAIRLPSEAEWEQACRAGTSTLCYWGDDMANIGDYCWWHDNCGGATHPVGQKKPNAWGLYDMMGLLWEYCSDGGPEAATHVCRGATFGSKIGMFKTGIRWEIEDAKVNDRFGFRVAMDVE